MGMCVTLSSWFFELTQFLSCNKVVMDGSGLSTPSTAGGGWKTILSAIAALEARCLYELVCIMKELFRAVSVFSYAFCWTLLIDSTLHHLASSCWRCKRGHRRPPPQL